MFGYAELIKVDYLCVCLTYVLGNDDGMCRHRVDNAARSSMAQMELTTLYMSKLEAASALRVSLLSKKIEHRRTIDLESGKL